MCPHSYLLGYTLGIRSPSGKKAAKGNVLHKAMELLAWQSYHRARGNKRFEEETFGLIRTEEISPRWAVDVSYRYYKSIETHLDWNDRYDLKDCQEWTQSLLELSNGYYDPRQMDVIEPEKRFDLVLEKPWAKYRYETPEGLIEGYLGLKGTIDLVVADRHDPDYIELCDYKSGRRLDWATGEEKTYEKLRKDPQLLTYLLAATHAFPGKTIAFSIIFVNDGGGFRIPFTSDDVALAEEMIRRKFEEIRADQHPALKKSWKCTKFCHFGKTMSDQDPSRTICEFFEGEVRKKGADAVTWEYGEPGAFFRYGCGGGRQEVMESV